MQNYQKRKEAKIAYYQAQAEKNRQIADQKVTTAMEELSVIPPGQPILVGHHSEKKHRALLNRVDSKMAQAQNASAKAEYYEQKAKACANNSAISSDDPEAIQKLIAKKEAISKKHEWMKAINKKHAEFLKKGEKTDFNGFSEKEINFIKEYKPKYSWETHPFPSYELNSNTAEIRRLEKRIKILERKAQDKHEEYTINDVLFVENVEENRLQLFFKGIPPEEIRKQLKSCGFRWSRYNKCWQAYRSTRATSNAKNIVNSMVEGV